ncbi:hypothetical protein [Moritella dasanensis]|uniref:hypothetical protein n=1 Tax=Moritella dasanensis TaxID=428031 RepID=UPI00037ED0C2|nr:hypothetical protein [Moritella dasanensis]
MISTYIDLVLLLSGLITSSLIIQVVAPRYALKAFYGLTVDSELALFLARAGGLPIATIGSLMIWASFNDAIQLPIIIAALISKTLFITLIVLNWKVTGKGYALTIAIDSIVVLLLSLYLLGVWS